MTMIERLAEGMGSEYATLETVTAVVFKSTHDRAAERRAFEQAERKIRRDFMALTSRKPVISSHVYFPQIGGNFWQVDFNEPSVLGETNTGQPLRCFPYRRYENARQIVGKFAELETGIVQPVTAASRLPALFDHEARQVPDSSYGFAITDLDVADLANSGLFELFGRYNKNQVFPLTRSNPDNMTWALPPAIDATMREQQAQFGQLVEELLVHEGFVQVQEPVWRPSTPADRANG